MEAGNALDFTLPYSGGSEYFEIFKPSTGEEESETHYDYLDCYLTKAIEKDKDKEQYVLNFKKEGAAKAKTAPTTPAKKPPGSSNKRIATSSGEDWTSSDDDESSTDSEEERRRARKAHQEKPSKQKSSPSQQKKTNNNQSPSKSTKKFW